VEYLANLLTAGDTDVIRLVLKRLAAMRRYMRQREVGTPIDESAAMEVGLTVTDLEDMYRLLAIAKYEDRYVIPKAHTEYGERMMAQQGACGLDFDGGPGNCGAVAAPKRPFGENFMLVEWIDKGVPVPTDVAEEPEHGEHLNLLDMLRPGQNSRQEPEMGR
jgi:nitrate reductase beta subunit